MPDNRLEEMNANVLAMERTRLAHERTLMAWVRTATSLISFGFTLYKFFQLLIEENRVTRVHHIIGPRQLGGLMIVLGMGSLGAALFQHRHFMKSFGKEYKGMPRSVATITAGFIFVLGTLFLILTILNQ